MMATIKAEHSALAEAVVTQADTHKDTQVWPSVPPAGGCLRQHGRS